MYSPHHTYNEMCYVCVLCVSVSVCVCKLYALLCSVGCGLRFSKAEQKCLSRRRDVFHARIYLTYNKHTHTHATLSVL